MIQPVFFPFSVAELLHFGYFFAPKLAGANPEPALDPARAHTPFLAENPGFPNPKVPRGNPKQFRREGKYKGGSCEASSELRSKKARNSFAQPRTFLDHCRPSTFPAPSQFFWLPPRGQGVRGGCRLDLLPTRGLPVREGCRLDLLPARTNFDKGVPIHPANQKKSWGKPFVSTGAPKPHLLFFCGLHHRPRYQERELSILSILALLHQIVSSLS